MSSILIISSSIMQFKINIWSQVRCISDGTEMIITSCTKRADGTEYFTCKWQEGQELMMADFPAEELEVK